MCVCLCLRVCNLFVLGYGDGGGGVAFTGAAQLIRALFFSPRVWESTSFIGVANLAGRVTGFCKHVCTRPAGV